MRKTTSRWADISRKALVGAVALATATGAMLAGGSANAAAPARAAASSDTTSVAALVSNGFTIAGLADWDNDGYQDIIARDRSGYLWLYPGTGRRGYSNQGRYLIGNGWNGYTFAGIADWDNDGYQDIITRSSNGNLYLYPGTGRRGYSNQGRYQIGNGWNGYTFAGLADWDNDGYQDIITKASNGNLYLYPGTGRRGYSNQGRYQIGNGW